MSLFISADESTNGLILSGMGAKPIPFQVKVSYRLDDSLTTWTVKSVQDGEITEKGWKGYHAPLTFDLSWEPGELGLYLDFTIRNNSNHPVYLIHVCPAIFHLGKTEFTDLDRFQIFQHGYQSWTPTQAVPAISIQQYPRVKSFALMNHYVDSSFWGRKDGIISALFTMLRRINEPAAALFGFTAQKKGYGELFLQNRQSPRLTGQLDYGGKRLEPGETLPGERFAIFYDEAKTVLERFTAELGCQMDARLAEKSLTGWCSWYEFYTRVTEENIFQSTSVLAEHPELNVDVVQLDDGYQTAIGDWRSLNKKFPSGLKALTEEVHRRGYKAGIWLAPFFASSKSSLFKEHPEWFLKNEKNKPVYCGLNPSWQARLYALDLTHPEVRTWLKSTFEAFVKDGFDYFKVDFLFAGLRAGKRHDDSYSPVEAYRLGLSIIREAIGENGFLLGCGAPIGPSVGFVDAMRVSEDVKEIWESRFMGWLGRGCGVPTAKGSLRNNVYRYFTHRRLWLNDPDCVLIRDKNTRLFANEVQTLITVFGLTGGMLFLSDDLTTLNLERLNWLETILPPTRLTGEPIDLFETPVPGTFQIEYENRRVLALLNWSNKEKVINLDEIPGLMESVLFNFWQREVHRTGEIKLSPHSTAALIVSPSLDIPAVVGTSLHLAALVDGRIKAEYDDATKLLIITGRDLSRRTGKLWIKVPPGLKVHQNTLDDKTVEINSWEDGLCLSLDTPAPWTAQLRFQSETI
ncbi:MAG: alpha-galactosidase [Deltaproteobacteria bacterium]|nr:alpha-galactosidase [Deltaproteobacteria bacterium]MBW2053126.1 alpha-galactosidase [Deltaproteobacteria bacterium]MBW2141899.1 alpha-galactosidase [Deltaproteobacteria bacterium]MBW2323502.1 alpha-galactosidase [Deltaproteobacteria bacterium]